MVSKGVTVAFVVGTVAPVVTSVTFETGSKVWTANVVASTPKAWTLAVGVEVPIPTLALFPSIKELLWETCALYPIALAFVNPFTVASAL